MSGVTAETDSRRKIANCVECGAIDSIHRAAGGFCADCYAEVRGGEQ